MEPWLAIELHVQAWKPAMATERLGHVFLCSLPPPLSPHSCEPFGWCYAALDRYAAISFVYVADKPLINFGEHNPLMVIKDDDVTLTCDVDANPAASSIHWLNSAGALIGKCVRFVEHTGQRFKKSAVFSSMFVECYKAHYRLLTISVVTLFVALTFSRPNFVNSFMWLFHAC